MSRTFINLTRSAATKELLKKHHKEYILLSFIALRARRDFKFGLAPGEALVGDFENMGLTRQQYRTALKNLEKWEILTTKSTNKGTVAKLIDTGIFDINIPEPNHPDNQQPTNSQPSSPEKLTTNKNINNNKKVIRKKRKSLSDRVNSICFPPHLESDEVKILMERWCKRLGYNWYSDALSLQGFVNQFTEDTAEGFAKKLKYALENTTWRSLSPEYFKKKNGNGSGSYTNKADKTTLLMAEAANNIKETNEQR